MGLNTLVKKLYVPTEDSDLDDFHAFDEYPELEIFDRFRVYRPVDRFDFEPTLTALGYSPTTPIEITEWNEITEWSSDDIAWESYTINVDDEIYVCRLTIKIVGSEEEIKLVNPPSKTIEVAGVFAETIADLRKGANSLFYKEGRWDGSCVTTSSELDHVFRRYFSAPIDPSESPYIKGDCLVLPSYAEYELTAEEMSSRFQEEIIDSFVEGETFVKFA